MTRIPSRFASRFDNLGTVSRVALGLAMGLLTSSTALAGVAQTDLTNQTGRAAPQLSVDPAGNSVEHTGACSDGARFHCFARVVTHDGGRITPNAAVQGYGPETLVPAYGIDVTGGATATVAIVDAYGYSALEADLGVYRAQYGLPPCTKANGCLKVVNQTGGATLPANPPANDDWTVETALDMDMVSAACPKCKILVVQATTDQDDGLFIANNTAASLGATVISNSWGGAEQAGVSEATYEPYFNHNIPVFVSAGDAGYNDNGQGPDYPATSAYAISVGGTSLTKTTGARGFTERAWGSTGTTETATDITNNGAGGSACSLSIAKPAYQPANSGCAFKATADVSAVGDPATGLAVYDSGAGGWQVVGGTSASSPMIAAMMAGAGQTHVTGAFFYTNAAKFNDVTVGANGSCGTILCKTGAGWDGPTGVGTPNMAAIKSGGGTTTGTGPTVAITSPADGATVVEGFQVAATIGQGVTNAELYVDGTLITSSSQGPFSFTAPSDLTTGSHTVEVKAYDSGNNTTTTTITVSVAAGGGGGGSDATNGDANSNDVIGGCAAGGSGGGLGIVLALGAVVIRRRRK